MAGGNFCIQSSVLPGLTVRPHKLAAAMRELQHVMSFSRQLLLLGGYGTVVISLFQAAQFSFFFSALGVAGC